MIVAAPRAMLAAVVLAAASFAASAQDFPQKTVRFIVRYDDYAGKWMFHCHILTHEDHGMMGVLEIR